MKPVKEFILIVIFMALYSFFMIYVISTTLNQEHKEQIDKYREQDMENQWRIHVAEELNIQIIKERDSLFYIIHPKTDK